MFSQFRQAVESFAPPPPRRGSQDASVNEAQVSRSRSPDITSPRQSVSSNQMAESALLNLKKSLAAQRSGSPGPSSSSSMTKSNSLPEQEMRVHKSNLEERLRAKFAIGDASNSTTPAASGRASPAPIAVLNHPLSPSSTPLPESPALTPAQVVDTPAIAPLASSPTVPSPEHTIHSPQPLSSLVQNVESMAPIPPEIKDDRSPEADIPLPPQTPGENVRDENVTEQLDVPDTEAHDSDIDGLQERLKLVEQRFSDVSTSFKRLQAEKLAADTILRQLTPLESIQDVGSLRDFLQNVALKAEISQDEINRLNGKLTRQDERIGELRDTHRLESASQSDQIEKLRRQVDEAEALLKASHGSISQNEEESAKQKAEVARLHAEVERSKGLAKEEEEKRVKAISLLKTVRQKLVKAEKEKEDAVKEVTSLKDKEMAEREKEKSERIKLQHEVDAGNLERERAVAGLKAQFDRELVNLKDRYEKDVSAVRGQFELEAVTSKGAYAKDIASKNSQISSLESSVNSLSREKNTIFDQLQLRQAELESSQLHLDSLQSQNTELQYQLRESNDRIALLNEELFEARRDQDSRVRGSNTSAEEVARLLSAAEAKYESKIAELKKDLDSRERERNDGEADWSRKLREKTRETEELKRVLESSSRTRDQEEGAMFSLREEIERLKAEIRLHQKQISDMRLRSDKIKEVEDLAKQQLQDSHVKTATLEHQIEESRSREAQLRVNNKTLREELRKVQSSAALLEKQRNPGVGYWTSRTENNSSDPRVSISSSASDLPSRVGSPRPGTPSTPTPNDEEVNLEYLRNVVLQFLEHKEMRPNLVRVLSIILHFTPQETRRLIAKV